MTAADDEQLPPAEELKLDRTRTSSAWTALAVTLLLALLVVIFIFQNDHDVPLEFLWMEFTVPAGVGLLAATIVGGLLVVLLGTARVLQLRLTARRHRRADRRSRRR